MQQGHRRGLRHALARSALCLLAATYLAAALAPCPPSAQEAPLPAAGSQVAHGTDEAPCPHHAHPAPPRPPAELAAACPCGCAGASGPAATQKARLGMALLHAAPALPDLGRAAPPPGEPAALPDAPTWPSDHVPLAALG